MRVDRRQIDVVVEEEEEEDVRWGRKRIGEAGGNYRSTPAEMSRGEKVALR